MLRRSAVYIHRRMKSPVDNNVTSSVTSIQQPLNSCVRCKLTDSIAMTRAEKEKLAASRLDILVCARRRNPSLSRRVCTDQRDSAFIRADPIGSDRIGSSRLYRQFRSYAVRLDGRSCRTLIGQTSVQSSCRFRARVASSPAEIQLLCCWWIHPRAMKVKRRSRIA